MLAVTDKMFKCFIFCLFILFPKVIFCSEQECSEIRHRLYNLYNAPSELEIDEARAKLKAELDHYQELEPSCLKDIKGSCKLAERCLETLSTKNLTDGITLSCAPDFNDLPVLQYAVRGAVRDNVTMNNIISNTERFLDANRRCQMYNALTKETLKGDLKTIQNLHRSILANLVNPYTTRSQNIKLKEAIKTLALRTMMNKVEGKYHPGFMIQLTKVCNYTATRAVRDAIVDIARLESALGTRKIKGDLNLIAQPVLELYEYLTKDDLVHPFGMLIGYATSLLVKSSWHNTLNAKYTDQIHSILKKNPPLFNNLFAYGEFCQRADFSLDEVQSTSTSAWGSEYYIRNKGTFSNPQYTWYNWTKSERDGNFLMVSHDNVRMLFSTEKRRINFGGTVYVNSPKQQGVFKEITPDRCSPVFKTTPKIMSFPLDSMMGVYKEVEETGKPYLDILEKPKDCPTKP